MTQILRLAALGFWQNQQNLIKQLFAVVFNLFTFQNRMPHKSKYYLWVFMVGKEVANPIEPWILTLKAFTDSFRGPIQTQFNWSDPKKHSKESRELRQKHTYYFRFILDSAKTEKSIHSSHNKQASKIGSFLFFVLGWKLINLSNCFTNI